MPRFIVILGACLCFSLGSSPARGSELNSQQLWEQYQQEVEKTKELEVELALVMSETAFLESTRLTAREVRRVVRKLEAEANLLRSRALELFALEREWLTQFLAAMEEQRPDWAQIQTYESYRDAQMRVSQFLGTYSSTEFEETATWVVSRLQAMQSFGKVIRVVLRDAGASLGNFVWESHGGDKGTLEIYRNLESRVQEFMVAFSELEHIAGQYTRMRKEIPEFVGYVWQYILRAALYQGNTIEANELTLAVEAQAIGHQTHMSVWAMTYSAKNRAREMLRTYLSPMLARRHALTDLQMLRDTKRNLEWYPIDSSSRNDATQLVDDAVSQIEAVYGEADGAVFYDLEVYRQRRERMVSRILARSGGAESCKALGNAVLLQETDAEHERAFIDFKKACL